MRYSEGRFSRLTHGKTAPAFCLPRLNSTDDDSYHLTDLTVTGPVVLVFCPVENDPQSELAWALRDLDWLQVLPGARVAIVATSDSQTVRDFVNKTELETPVLSDPDGQVSARYGLASSPSGEPESAIFLIDHTQTIEQCWTTQQSLATIDLTRVATDVKQYLDTTDTPPKTTSAADDHPRRHDSELPEVTPLDTLELRTDRLHVRKSLRFRKEGIGIVTFTIESNQEAAVDVQLTDRLPKAVDQRCVRCHTGDHGTWTLTDDTSVYETAVPAGGHIETWYAVDISEPTNFQQFGATPDVTITSEADSPEQLENLPAAKSPLESTPMTDQNSTADTSMTDDKPADDTFVTEEQVSSSQPNRPPETPSESTATSSNDSLSDGAAGTTERPDRASTSSGVDAERDSRTVVSALARELEQETLTDHERDVLADHFSQFLSDRDGQAVAGSAGARLRHVQTTVDDLEAYTAALEEFLDENGSAHELTTDIEDIHSAVKALEADLATVEDRLESVTAQLDELDAVMDQVERLDEQVDDVTRTTQTLREHQESMANRLTTLDKEFESLREAVEHTQTFQEAMRTALVHGQPPESVADVDPSS